MNFDIGKLDKALDRVLEAAVDHPVWQEVLDDLVEATGSYAANIIPATSRIPNLVIATDGVKAILEEYFSEGWHIRDWRVRALSLLEKQGTACDQQYTTQDEFRNLDYYRFHAKYGVGKTCMIGFSVPEDLLCLTLHRTLSNDFFNQNEAAILRRVRDRLMVAATMMRHMSAHRIGGMVEAFHSTGIAAVFFDRFCRVTEITANAEVILGKEIFIRDKTIHAYLPEVTVAIQRRMRTITSERWLQPDGADGALLIPRKEGRPLSVRVQRLGGSLPDFFAHSVGLCLLDDPDRAKQRSRVHLNELFGLTDAEAGIAQLVAGGLSLKEIATKRSISYETVRTHVRSIFLKTDTKRQAELTAVLARLNY